MGNFNSSQPLTVTTQTMYVTGDLKDEWCLLSITDKGKPKDPIGSFHLEVDGEDVLILDHRIYKPFKANPTKVFLDTSRTLFVIIHGPFTNVFYVIDGGEIYPILNSDEDEDEGECEVV